MKTICIITSYFPPETGAASNRMAHMAHGLTKQGYNVTVITPLPNYPTGKVFKPFKGQFKHTSIENNITIHRLWIYASNSKNKIKRLIAMLSYSFSLVWFFLFNKLPYKIIVQSPPLLVAFTCMLFLRKSNHKLILNVSDLWPIAGLELGTFKKNFSYKVLEKIEHYNYKKAHLVLGQSDEILSHITSIHPKKETFLYRNYPDFKPLPIQSTFNERGKIRIVYAGLLGHAQGIYKLCKELDYTNIEFHIYGMGAEQDEIKTYISKHKELPIFYHGGVSREELHVALKTYDITIIPLLNRIYGSVPSKIFEYARLGLPIIYFGGGEGETIIKKYALGWIAASGNYNDLNHVINSISLSKLDANVKSDIQKRALKHFDFEKQLKSLSKVL
ncbi:glycosyltransferase family 4 protein [Mangrovimonas spongiae]|uniref:Glycosyltransferase WbuB n=1 Tax=Mangrovimonas spongiae TaxID=2494697 RepID=A0A3R9NQW4_9FLAO|nr:glycosyltransferase family 4 protein [Mangrovimonas spongiae]RSK41501.1 glycosyltransferase WbuB [Mangrovimonas spongiae]